MLHMQQDYTVHGNLAPRWFIPRSSVPLVHFIPDMSEPSLELMCIDCRVVVVVGEAIVYLLSG